MKYALLGKTMKYTVEKMLAFWECGVLECWVCSMGSGTHKMYNFLVKNVTV